MKFGKLEMDPARNPAVLDTATWDRSAAWKAVRAGGDRWSEIRRTVLDRQAVPRTVGIEIGAGSIARQGSAVFLLAVLQDGQQVFVRIGPGDDGGNLGEELGRMPLGDGDVLSAYPTDASVIDRYCRTLKPVNAPRALGSTPRLGIGVRMTAAAWPGIFDAMDRRGFAANSIQNSVRELNMMEDLFAGKPPPRNYACGFGTIETGYTGSSFEGLWVSGVLAALGSGKLVHYGADADHIQVKRADAGLAWAKRVLSSARHYTFYTIDVSDVLDYGALRDESGAEDRFATAVPDAKERKDLLSWHGQERRVGGQALRGDPVSAMRFAAKYAGAFDAVNALSEYIAHLKDGRAFDLELSIDEHPAEVGAFDCLTSEQEFLFVAREIRRRGLSVTHIAPNFGVEKGWDYRHPDGLEGLRRRVEAQYRLADEFGVMLDFHSADDLGSEARAVLRHATSGRLHYKISPSLQLLFAEVLRDFHPDLFRRWWDDAMAYAVREAEAGVGFAAECIAAHKAAGDHLPSPRDPVFHHYSFAFVGRRDENGQFTNRGEFYGLSPEFYEAHRRRMADRLCLLADELFN